MTDAGYIAFFLEFSFLIKESILSSQTLIMNINSSKKEMNIFLKNLFESTVLTPKRATTISCAADEKLRFGHIEAVLSACCLSFDEDVE